MGPSHSADDHNLRSMSSPLVSFPPITFGVFLFLSILISSRASSSLVFCPLTSPFGQQLYLGNVASSSSHSGLTKTSCAVECFRSSVCRCFNYNSSSTDCDLFDSVRSSPTGLVDQTGFTAAFQVSQSVSPDSVTL